MIERTHLRALHLLLALSVLLLFLGLGANTIWDANEAFYVDTPRHMVESGDYVNPQFNGAPRMNKPVLSYWVVAGFYQLFGVSVAVERLAIAIGAVGILLAAYVFGRTLHGHVTGVLSALLVATAPRFVMFSRRIFIDIWVTMFMALAMACFLLAEAMPQHRKRYLYLMYAAIGLGVLTKGPVALVFPAVTIGTWLLFERRLADITRLSLIPGALIVLAIVVPWWAVIYLQHGWEPLQAFWLGENLGRYTESMQPGERDVFFYIPVILGDLFPWTLFVIGGLVWAVRASWQRESPVGRLLLLWIVWHVGVFSLSQTKQDLYIFPIMPALAACAARVIVVGLAGESRWMSRASLATGALMTTLGIGAVWLFGAQAKVHQITGANALAAILVMGALMIAMWLWRARPALAVTTIAATFVASNYVFALVALPATEAYKPVRPFVEVIAARTRPGDVPPVVAHFRTVLPSMAYYLGRPIEEIFDMPTLVARTQQVPSMYILLRPDEFADWQMRMAPTNVSTCLVARHTLFEAKLGLVVQGKPWPELYLAGAGGACSSS